ncbi:MAG: TonB-dependent receptor, partial [Pseudomonadota bacterium]
RSYTVGVVVEPRWIDRMSLQVDYFRINIEDRISNLNLTQILGACFDSPSFPDTPACSNDLFVRDDAGQVIFGRTTSLNAANSSYKGVQGRWRYSFDVADAFGAAPKAIGLGGFADNDLGELSFDATVLRAIQNELQVLDEEADDPIGEFEDPKWQGTFDITYNWDKFRLFWRATWQDKPVFDSQFNSFISNVGPGDDAVVSTIDNVIDDRQRDRIIHNMSLQYSLFDTTTVQFAVNNVFDRFPGIVDFAAGNFGAPEQLGRTFNFRVRTQF